MLRPRRPVVVATHHRVEDLQDGGGALHPGIVRTATLVAGVREQRRDALQVTEVDELRVPVHDVLDGAAGIGRAGSRHDRDVTVRSFPSPREQRGTDADRRVAAFHVNVNCSDLERSLALLPRPPRAHGVDPTRPEAPQDGAAFGLDARAVGRVDPARRAGLRRAGSSSTCSSGRSRRRPGGPNRATDLGHNRLGLLRQPTSTTVVARLVARGRHHLRRAARDGVEGSDPCAPSWSRIPTG